MKWLKGLFGTEKQQPGDSGTDDPMEITDPMIAETTELADELGSIANELSEPSSEDLVWTEWFNGLSEHEKMIVEHYGENGVKVTPKNFGNILESLSDNQNK